MNPKLKVFNVLLDYKTQKDYDLRGLAEELKYKHYTEIGPNMTMGDLEFWSEENPTDLVKLNLDTVSKTDSEFLSNLIGGNSKIQPLIKES